MRHRKWLGGALFLLGFSAGPVFGQQIGKFVPVQAGSEVDHALTEINAATDPAQKLALIDKFAAGPGSEGDNPLLVDGLYVDYYIEQKNYDKAMEYGDKLFALDPDSFQNAMNMIRAASEKGDSERVVGYGEKAAGILKRFKGAAAPEGTAAQVWEEQKAKTLESNKEGVAYIQQAVYNGAIQARDPGKRAALLVRFAQAFPDSPYTNQALGVAATSYSQAQNTPKMLEVANGLLAKDPNNLGMLLVLSDYYCDKPDQFAKAEPYAKKAISVVDSAPKPEGLTDEQWARQKGLQKGLARRSVTGQQLPGGIFGAPRDGQQDVFRGNVLILEFLRFIKCRFEYLVRVFAQVLLRNTADLWETRKLRMDLRLQALRAHTETIEERRHDSIVLGHQRCQQVQGLKLLLACLCGNILRLLQRLLSLYRQFVVSQHLRSSFLPHVDLYPD